MGLHLMNYRARMVGGSLEVQRISTGGTMVTCLFPVLPLDGNEEIK
jgi:nitrate/nitrite-specific signal transduction histidine kinase